MLKWLAANIKFKPVKEKIYFQDKNSVRSVILKKDIEFWVKGILTGYFHNFIFHISNIFYLLFELIDWQTIFINSL